MRRKVPPVDFLSNQVPLPATQRTPIGARQQMACATASAAATSSFTATATTTIAGSTTITTTATTTTSITSSSSSPINRTHRHALRTSLIAEFCRPLGSAKWMFTGLVTPSIIWRVQSLLLATEMRESMEGLFREYCDQHPPPASCHRHHSDSQPDNNDKHDKHEKNDEMIHVKGTLLPDSALQRSALAVSALSGIALPNRAVEADNWKATIRPLVVPSPAQLTKPSPLLLLESLTARVADEAITLERYNCFSSL